MNLSSHWETVIDTMQDGLLIVNTRGEILKVNPAAEALTGYSSSELLGKSCRFLECSGCETSIKTGGDHYCRLFAETRIRRKRCTLVTKSRRHVDILKNASVLRDAAGKVIGAVETITDISELTRRELEIEDLKLSLHLTDGFHGITGSSSSMHQMFHHIRRVARTEAPVLITGQSGTGKELAARAVHQESPRKDGPFVKVNCAALNENLLESELFGHVRGAFTGAERTRVGRFEAAHGGTLLLDEIGDIPLSTQVKLLRVLEEKKIERVGENKSIPIDVRIISATNRNLEELVAGGLFREDFLFRINVFPIHCPPLSERQEDIPGLLSRFIADNNTASGRDIKGISPGAVHLLDNYPWPGNIRELRNTIQYAFVLCSGNRIEVRDLPVKIAMQAETVSYKPEVGRERSRIVSALGAESGNRTRAAARLGISRVTLWKKIKAHGISDGEISGTGS